MFYLREFACELTSSWSPAREEGWFRDAVRPPVWPPPVANIDCRWLRLTAVDWILWVPGSRFLLTGMMFLADLLGKCAPKTLPGRLPVFKMLSFFKKTTRRRQYHQSKRNLGSFSKCCHFSKKRPAGSNTTKVRGFLVFFKMWSFFKKTTRRRQYHQSKRNFDIFSKMLSFFKKNDPPEAIPPK